MATEESQRPPPKNDDLVARLAELSGSDLKSTLIELARRRAEPASPSTVADAHRSDRFVQPSPLELMAKNRIEAAFLEALPPSYRAMVLAPVVPFAAHRSVAGVHQDLVVATMRGTEVAADPTVGLALEAAQRRRDLLGRDSKSTERIALAACQRVTRAQPVDGIGSWAHFDIFALVTAGRDTGHHTFEVSTLVEHIGFHTTALSSVGADRVFIRLSDFSDGSYRKAIAAVTGAVQRSHDEAVVTFDPERQSGRHYYEGIVWNTKAEFAGTIIDVGDGGLVDWTQKLVASRKERLLTSGIGLDRIVMALASHSAVDGT